MKKVVLATIMLVALLLGGCGSGFVEGAATGGALSHTLAGVEADIQAEKERLLIEAAGASELEKEIFEQKIQVLEDMQTGIAVGKQATETDWKSPEAIGGFASTAVAAVLAWYFRKKGIVSQTKYQAHKQGAEKFMHEHNDAAGAELYNDIGAARATKNL